MPTTKTDTKTAHTRALDTYLVFDAEDPLNASLCRGEEATREIIDQFGCTAGLQVLRVTMGELVRDVTADFLPDEDEPDDAFGIPSHDSLRRWHERRVL